MPEDVNIVRSILKTVDDFLDNIGLGRPLEKVVDFLEATAPAKLARRVGLPPAPGELADQAASELIRSAETMTPPRPPSPEELRRRITGR